MATEIVPRLNEITANVNEITANNKRSSFSKSPQHATRAQAEDDTITIERERRRVAQREPRVR